jgi:acetoin utilization deacetylase AcuC-like enzyme
MEAEGEGERRKAIGAMAKGEDDRRDRWQVTHQERGRALVRVVSSDQHRRHDPRLDIQAGVPFEQVERPARAERIREALTADGSFVVQAPTDHGLAPIQAVHAPGLIALLEGAWQAWCASPPLAGQPPPPELFPDTVLHPALRAGMDSPSMEPTAVLGRLGYWCFDLGTPITPGTYAAARSAVDVALTAADLVLAGEPLAYGLCRPPGHHAASAAYGGFCFFNNAAIAAEYLVRQTGARVAVLDLDYHHGNGTQQIFYRRADVLYVSLHADPRRAYPYFTGHADETGAGPGAGATLNIPLPAGVTNDLYLDAVEPAREALAHFAPELTIVSLGVDTYGRDPLSDFQLTTPVYAECGRRLAAAARRLVVLQEGGYYLPDLGENVRQFLRGAASP